jgi:cytochrome c peroxidase
VFGRRCLNDSMEGRDAEARLRRAGRDSRRCGDAGGGRRSDEKGAGELQADPSTVPALKDNAVTREKVELGKLLFFDPRLSVSEIISCNTCHNLGNGGVDAGPTSVGHGWQKGSRRAPTVYNAVFNVAQFWDGRAADLKAQAKGPAQASVEMNATPEHVVTTLSSMPAYVEMFGKAFPKEASPVTFDNFARAIGAFEATLITPRSKFDLYLEGNAAALNEQETSVSPSS